MAKSKRKARKELVKKLDVTVPLDPIDIMKFGTEEDPCFGKHFDLTEDECKRCGDCNICQIVYNQETEKLREQQESNHRFKDLELTDKKKPKDKKVKKDDKIKLFIMKKLDEDLPKSDIIKKVMKKFDLEKSKARRLVKETKII